MHKKIPDSYLKREGGNPGNSGLSSQQQIVVHYPRTAWKNCHVEHHVSGKIYNQNLKKKEAIVGQWRRTLRLSFPNLNSELLEEGLSLVHDM